MCILVPFRSAGLIAYQAETQWPPTYPRPESLLYPSNDPSIPRESWGADEWKAYALFLEDEGRWMEKRLRSALEDLLFAQNKLTRKRKCEEALPVFETVLTSKPKQPKKRGRKAAQDTLRIAEAVLTIHAESERGLTDREALEEYWASKGLRRSRAHEKTSRNILNTVSRLRNRHDNSKS